MAANAKPLILFDSIFLATADLTITASGTAAGYDVDNITDLRPYTWWQADAHGTKYITLEIAEAQAADSLGIIGHNLATAEATVSLESSDTGAWGGEEEIQVAGFTPADDKAFLKIFTSASAAYWRLKIVTAAVAARLAVCVLGERLDFQRYPAGPFDPAPETVNATSARSKAGHLIGSTLQNIGIEISAAWASLTPAWIESDFRPAWDDHLSQLKPFFWAWDITNHATEVYFVAIPAGFSLSMPFDPYRRSLSLLMQGVKESG